MSIHRAVKMYDYHVWANRRVFNHLKQQPEKIFNNQIQGVFPSISAVLVHMYMVEMAWLETMKGNLYEAISQKIKQKTVELNGQPLEVVEAAFETLAEDFHRFLAGEEDLERVIEVEHPHYGRSKFALADIIHHLANHGTYHRGHISAMSHQQGEKGASTDYIFFVEE
ncbi:DinB family protein [Planococcus shixiaomingii]|uniref:DinB family protein n=1 Tax=Planococcus shixiaomingii TaxID=3058393 RepID=UPI0026037A99|nr:DinB family protein [Planococcus sp. N022]WKA54626.1 DinB family protein [Planococcus sp. N022]